MLYDYKIIYRTADSLDMSGCVTIDKNQNINHLKNLLLKCYFKLGYNSLSTVQWIGRQGWLGKLGENTGSKNVKIPKCAACQYRKQDGKLK